MNNSERLSVPRMDAVKFIDRSNGTIKGYAVNTFHGLVKNYNQDRVSIIMNITKPNHKGRWPRCSYFGVFDGHGGNKCSDFLKENMHRYITQNAHFPHEPIEALKFGFKKAEQQFVAFAESQEPIERSGSCALVLLIIDDICYIANVGDCRAILSANQGKHVYAISKDHKPDSETERERIFNAGGKIYQSSIKSKNGATMLGPYRIEPGKLSVSRSFGDIEAKLPKYEGNPKVLIAKPEITYFEINNNQHDFVVMCSDGVYDKLSNQQVAECFWDYREKNTQDNYQFIGGVPSRIIERSMQKMSTDNLTSLVIFFEDQGRLMLPGRKSRVMQREQTKRPKSSNQFQSENRNRMNKTRKITPSKHLDQEKPSGLAKIEQLDASLQSSRQMMEKQRKENRSDNVDRSLKETRDNMKDVRDSIRDQKEKMAKRKSSANLLGSGRWEAYNSQGMNNSISAKLLVANSKVFGKRKDSQKVSLNDLLNKKKQGGKKEKQTLLGQMMQKVDRPQKLIRF